MGDSSASAKAELAPSVANGNADPAASAVSTGRASVELKAEAPKSSETRNEPAKTEYTHENSEVRGSSVSKSVAGDATSNSDVPSNVANAPKLKLKLGPDAESEAGSAPGVANRYSQRRSERMRNQALKAEETRRVREERAAVEEARAKARSIAAKKAAATKRNAAKKDASKGSDLKIAPKPGAGSKDSSRVSKRMPKRIVKLRYFNPAVPPTFAPVSLGATALPVFWLRANLREFLYRFDKLCRLPARLTSGLNDPLEPWTPEQFKAVIVALLKLIANDAKPLLKEVRNYLAEIEVLEPSSPRIWDWLLEFVEQLDAHAPREVPTTEEEQLDLLRRLLVICTGTETIRITVMSDVEQLKWVEKEAQDEIKAITAKLKETEQKLAKLKSVDKEVYAEKLGAAQRSAANKVWRAQQQLFTKTHKFNMRTAPVAQDPHGNMYWSLQYKSAAQAAWGSWVVCEMRNRPTELAAWYQKLSSDVSRVLRSRDLMVAEKNEERRRLRKEKQDTHPLPEDQTPQPVPEDLTQLQSSPGSHSLEREDGDASMSASKLSASLPGDGKDSESVDAKAKRQPKRRYPKLKINRPEALAEPELYIVEGRENIRQLAAWIGGFAGVDKKAVSELEAVATYLAQDD